MSAAATSWDKWAEAIDAAKKGNGAGKAAPAPNPAIYSALTKAIASAAASYTPNRKGAPKLAVAFDSSLHGNLESVALDCLKHFLDVEGGLDAMLASYTTTDISAAMQIAGVKTTVKGAPCAVVSLVVTETAGQQSWSRLENLVLHWATQQKPGAEWEPCPSGWKSDVGNDDPQGSVWDSHFEKHPLAGAAGNESMYTLVLQVPLTGSLATGGLVFVMKGESGSNPTRWLKDAKTSSDFFINVQQFPQFAK